MAVSPSRFIILAVVLFPALVLAAERRVRLADLPPAVRSAIRAKTPPGGAVGEVTQSTEPDGRYRYDAILTDKDGNEALETFHDAAPANVTPTTPAVPPATQPAAAAAATPTAGADSDDNVPTDDDGNVPTASLPPAVRATFEKESDGTPLPAKIARDGDGPDATYDAEIVIKGKTYEVEVRRDGTLVSKVLTDEPEAKPTETPASPETAK